MVPNHYQDQSPEVLVLRSIITITLASLLALASEVSAELPPQAYAAAKQNAPELVAFQVKHIAVSSKSYGSKAITIRGRICEICRTESGLQAGDSITVRYTIRSTTHNGPSRCPLLKQNGVYAGYLKRSGGAFTVSAWGQSFVRLR